MKIDDLRTKINEKVTHLKDLQEQRDQYVSNRNWDDLRKHKIVELIQQYNEEKIELENELKELTKHKMVNLMTYDNQNILSTGVVRRK